MSIRRTTLILTLLALAAAACAGPAAPGGQAPADSGKPVSGGQLNMLVLDDPKDWDPNFEGRGTPSRYGLAKGYNSLLVFQNGPDIEYADMRLRPELAERWEVTPDGTAVTFHLRRGVKFANLPPVNGRELTSADVKWTVEYYTRTGAFKDKNLPDSRNGYMYLGMERVETPDAYTVRFQFKDPFAPFIAYSASDWNPVVAREVYEQEGHHHDRIIGSGPFYLDVQASQQGTRWVWKKNPSYWDEGRPYLDEIRWLVVRADSSALAAFQTKQIDLMYDMEYQEAQDAIKGNPGAQSFKFLQPRAAGLRVSQVAGKATTDIRVRKAVDLALDRDEINKVFTSGAGIWAMPTAMAGMFTEAEAKQAHKHDLVEAKRLLVEAGYPDGVTLELPTDDARSQSEITFYQLLQAQLKRAGINLDWKVMTMVQQRQKRRAGDYGLDASTGLGGLEADADSIIYGEFHSSLRNSTNNSKINDPELDKLLDGQRREMNPEKRRELLRAAVKRIHEQVWYIGLLYPPNYDVVQPYVKGYYPHFSVAPYLTVWIQK